MPRGMTELKQRIVAVRQMRQVSAAMQKVSAARLARLRREAEHASLYTGRLRRLMADLGDSVSAEDHAFLQPGKGTIHYAVVFGSDRGLCGGFNRVLMEEITRFGTSRTGGEIALLVIGKLAARRAAKMGVRVEASFPQPIDLRAADDLLHQLADLVTDAFVGGRAADVHALYADFSAGRHKKPALLRLLPVPFGEDAYEPGQGRDLRAAVFEPDANTVVSRLLRESVFLTLRDAYLNSSAAENAARQESMGGAAENAGKLLSEMMMAYRRLRQESITTEIIEVAGALRYGD